MASKGLEEQERAARAARAAEEEEAARGDVKGDAEEEAEVEAEAEVEDDASDDGNGDELTQVERPGVEAVTPGAEVAQPGQPVAEIGQPGAESGVSRADNLRAQAAQAIPQIFGPILTISGVGDFLNKYTDLQSELESNLYSSAVLGGPPITNSQIETAFSNNQVINLITKLFNTQKEVVGSSNSEEKITAAQVFSKSTENNKLFLKILHQIIGDVANAPDNLKEADYSISYDSLTAKYTVTIVHTYGQKLESMCGQLCSNLKLEKDSGGKLINVNEVALLNYTLDKATDEFLALKNASGNCAIFMKAFNDFNVLLNKRINGKEIFESQAITAMAIIKDEPSEKQKIQDAIKEAVDGKSTPITQTSVVVETPMTKEDLEIEFLKVKQDAELKLSEIENMTQMTDNTQQVAKENELRDFASASRTNVMDLRRRNREQRLGIDYKISDDTLSVINYLEYKLKVAIRRQEKRRAEAAVSTAVDSYYLGVAKDELAEANKELLVAEANLANFEADQKVKEIETNVGSLSPEKIAELRKFIATAREILQRSNDLFKDEEKKSYGVFGYIAAEIQSLEEKLKELAPEEIADAADAAEAAEGAPLAEAETPAQTSILKTAEAARDLREAETPAQPINDGPARGGKKKVSKVGKDGKVKKVKKTKKGGSNVGNLASIYNAKDLVVDDHPPSAVVGSADQNMVQYSPASFSAGSMLSQDLAQGIAQPSQELLSPLSTQQVAGAKKKVLKKKKRDDSPKKKTKK